jgi:hypothetical protein
MTIWPAWTPAQTCAARMRLGGLGRFDQHKARQQAVHAGPDAQGAWRLRCSSPIDAGGHQGNGAGVHHVNDAPEPPRQAFASASWGKAGRKGLEVAEHRPAQPFGQRRVTMCIGVGKGVAAWRGGPPQGRKRPAGPAQRVTDVIEANPMSQLGQQHADHVTPGPEGSRLGIHAGLARQFSRRDVPESDCKAVAEP